MRIDTRLAGAAVCAIVLATAGCATPEGLAKPNLYAKPTQARSTSTEQDLVDLPDPSAPVAVAVYGFNDQTGQFNPTDNIQTLSRALSQGATSVLVQSLRDAGRGKWFTVLEREHLDDLLKERQVITEMRKRYLGETEINPDALPSLLFAGVLLEGGIIGYDTNTLTGGAGARLLGIGGDASYRQDTITVYLRAVATKTGEVLASVVTRKTVVSAGLQGGAFRYVSYKNLLETEAGVTVNEPRTIALEQAVEKATYDLILEGAHKGVWSFADKTAANALIHDYLAENDRMGGADPVVARAPAPPAPASRMAATQPPSAVAELDARTLRAVPAPPQAPIARPGSAPIPPIQPAQPAAAKKAAPAAPAAVAPAAIATVRARPAMRVAAAAPVPPVRPAAPGGSAAVQIGAYASPALAEQGWQDASAAFPGLLAGRSRRVEPVQRAGKTLYRALVAGFADAPAARAFCDALKARQRDCLVRNFGPARTPVLAAQAPRHAPAAAEIQPAALHRANPASVAAIEDSSSQRPGA